MILEKISWNHRQQSTKNHCSSSNLKKKMNRERLHAISAEKVLQFPTTNLRKTISWFSFSFTRLCYLITYFITQFPYSDVTKLQDLTLMAFMYIVTKVTKKNYERHCLIHQDCIYNGSNSPNKHGYTAIYFWEKMYATCSY